MKSRLTILIFCIGVMVYNVSAQVPGYLGKKTMIGVNMHYSPAWGKLFDVGNKGSFLFPSPGVGFSIKQVISEDNTITFDFSYQKLRISDDYMDEDYKLYKDVNGKVKTISVGYTRSISHVAPMGLYGGFNVAFALIEAEGKSSSSNIVSSLGNFADIGICTTAGTRRVINDNIMIDFGVSLNYYIVGIFSAMELGSGSSAIQSATGLNAVNNFAQLKLGVLYLL